MTYPEPPRCLRRFLVCPQSSILTTMNTTPHWTPYNLSSHLEACQILENIKNRAFSQIRNNVGSITDLDVQQFILNEFVTNGLISSDGEPIVATNSNSQDPHYTPTQNRHSIICAGDWILIDIWAKLDQDDAAFADITWIGFTGTDIPKLHQQLFHIVVTARDLVVESVQNAWEKEEVLQGWQLDRVARDYIIEKGYGECFIHTTGHSLGPGNSVHAPGVGLNDFSGHDTREIIENIGFSVEPGIYIPECGMRSEINVYMDCDKGPVVTTPQQDTIILC